MHYEIFDSSNGTFINSIYFLHKRIELMSGHVEITITESDIKKTLLHYNYGSYISHKNISFGYANENFKVTTTVGNILFRLYKKKIRR